MILDNLIEYRYERRLLPSRIGGLPTHRSVPTGMPKIKADLINCAFYLYRIDPKTGEREPEPRGTGFIVSRRWKNTYDPRLPSVAHYGVTNWHLANQQGSSIIRLNTYGGGCRFLDCDPLDWHFQPYSDDLSIIDLTDDVRDVPDLFTGISESAFATPEYLEQGHVLPGYDTFMIGMFARHYGETRNVPAFRFGNIAMLPTDDVLVPHETGVSRQSYLVDTRSRSGFSGSPVFIYEENIDFSALLGDGAPLVKRGYVSKEDLHPDSQVASPQFQQSISLLGVHCGQYWEEVEFKKDLHTHEKIGDTIKEGDTLFIKGGMTVVVPAWRITELLNSKVFEDMRDERDKKNAADRSKRPAAESIASISEKATSVSSEAENPEHAEDFTRLVNAAAKKQKPNG